METSIGDKECICGPMNTRIGIRHGKPFLFFFFICKYNMEKEKHITKYTWQNLIGL
jgi:hypothetical protein